jgi:hypothetical protein
MQSEKVMKTVMLACVSKLKEVPLVSKLAWFAKLYNTDRQCGSCRRRKTIIFVTFFYAVQDDSKSMFGLDTFQVCTTVLLNLSNGISCVICSLLFGSAHYFL